MQLPSAFRGAAKVIDNQDSICLHTEDENSSAVNPKKQTQKTEQTKTLKKLLDNQNGLHLKCDGILEQIEDGLSQSETKVAKIALDYNQAVS